MDPNTGYKCVAQAIYDRLQFGQQVSHSQLSDMLGKASEKSLFAPSRWVGL